jgi:hypothetical protein
MHNNNSLQNLYRKRDELDRQLKNIERRIKAHANSILDDRIFTAEFQKEIEKLPPPPSGSRAPRVDRLTKDHGKMLSKNFVEKSKKHPKIQEVLRRIPKSATNRDIDAIVRQTLVRLKRHTKKDLMSNALMTKIMRNVKNTTPQNKPRRRSIPNNLRHVHIPGPVPNFDINPNIGDILNFDPDLFNQIYHHL